MVDYSKMPHNKILCIDMKSFYASCSAVMLGLDPLECYLAVVGNVERQGSVVLAASPRLKKEFGVKTGSRLFEIPDDPRIQLVEPKMATYLRISTEITRVFHRYVPKEAIHTYSVDESFIQVDGVIDLWGDPMTIAKKSGMTLNGSFSCRVRLASVPICLWQSFALILKQKNTGLPNGHMMMCQKNCGTFPRSGKCGNRQTCRENAQQHGHFHSRAIGPLRLEST